MLRLLIVLIIGVRTIIDIASWVPMAQTPAPTPACSGIESTVNVVFSPANCIEFGEQLTLDVHRLDAFQLISYVLSDETGSAGGRDRSARVNPDGTLSVQINTRNFLETQLRPGNYSVFIKTVLGQRPPVRAAFRVIDSTATIPPCAPPPTPTPEPPAPDEPSQVPEDPSDADEPPLDTPPPDDSDARTTQRRRSTASETRSTATAQPLRSTRPNRQEAKPTQTPRTARR